MEDFSNLICLEEINQLEIESKEETNKDEKYNKIFLSLPIYRASLEQDHVVFSDDWFKTLRSEAILWILKTSINFRMGLQTAYMAVSYFDRFSLKRSIDKEKPWSVRLLSIACLSLAAKMEEYHAPFLSEYYMDGYEFTNDNIKRMELLVLSTLDWRLSCVSYLDFLNFSETRFNGHDGSNGLSKGSEERLNNEQVEELKINIFSLCEYTEKEHVHACYNAMNQVSDIKGVKLPKRPFINDSIEGMNVSLSCNKRIRLHLQNI